MIATPFFGMIDAARESANTGTGELAEPFRMSLPAVSKHLKALERAGLIARGRDAQRRPCRLAAGPLKEVAAFAERYRRHWEESFDRLDEYLEIMKRKPAKASPKKRSHRGG